MRPMLSRTDTRLALLTGLALLFSGCGEGDAKVGAQKDKGKGVQVAKADAKPVAEHKHDGWWCDEHGIPEAECSMCSGKVAAECKKKGDWCDKHDRAKSQCFLCEPMLKEKYTALYKAKFGKEPPATEDEEKAKDGAKK